MSRYRQSDKEGGLSGATPLRGKMSPGKGIVLLILSA